MDKTQEVTFHTFLKALRKGKKVTLDRLSRGICSASMLARIEAGERLPEKIVRDRFLERLGLTNDGYEDYLQPDEHALWESWKALLRAVENKDYKEADSLIEQYERDKRHHSNVIERQFYLAMKGQLAQYRNVPEAELCMLYEKALRLTVPEITYDEWRKQSFSLQEWNLLLEYIHFGGDIGKIEWEEDPYVYQKAAYELLLEEFQKAVKDVYGRAKIFPKAVYYYGMVQMKQPKADWECEKLLRLCRQAIAMLRSTGRTYYLYELLEIKEKLITVSGQGALFEKEMTETRELKKVLSALYRKYHVSEKKENCCYLYWQTDNERIGDVIRKRRKLLGLTQKQLCEGICEPRTLQRLESNKTRAQMAVVRQLLERLGLPFEFQRLEVISDNYEAVVLYREMCQASNAHESDRAEKLLQRLVPLISMQNIQNRQEVKRSEALNQLKQGKITLREYVEQMEKALGYTVASADMKNLQEGYLTCTEIGCIYNIATRVEEGEAWQYFKPLWEIYNRYEEENDVEANISMYLLVMIGIASHLGNVGRYRESNRISDRAIKESLKSGRIYMLHNYIYNKCWNDMECQKPGIPAETACTGQAELQACILLSRFCQEKSYEAHYCRKMKEWYG
ncbi:MAG: helix-turn-helix transcriptional regulator [Lachnospiraceae bacterium]|nr:helix-turn-helix transcriptional regulator [Lachnospiraceae bacterium]